MFKSLIKNPKKIKTALSVSAVFLAFSVIFFLYANFKSASQSNLWKGFFVTKQPEEIKKISIDKRLFEFGLNITKISALLPVVANVDGTNKTAYNKALLSGVAHYKGTALPGEGSNIFIFGHSSTWNGTGQYAEAFAKLNDLEKGDEVIVYYQNKEYKYKVTAKEIIAAEDFSYLEPTKKPQLTLMTCWPIGSNLKRLVVVAKIEQ